MRILIADVLFVGLTKNCRDEHASTCDLDMSCLVCKLNLSKAVIAKAVVSEAPNFKAWSAQEKQRCASLDSIAESDLADIRSIIDSIQRRHDSLRRKVLPYFITIVWMTMHDARRILTKFLVS